jgi:hypothetical protein
MATKKVTRSKGTKKPAAKAPAEVIREARQRASAALEMPIETNDQVKASTAAHAAARKDVRDIQVPMTLGELCTVLGSNIGPEHFGASALASFADQLETIAVIVDSSPDHSSDAWRLFQNLAERASFASKIVTWMAEVQP